MILGSYNDILRQIKIAGSFDVNGFGGLYDGAYYLEQLPEEAAEFICFLKKSLQHPRILEIGSAAGGMVKLLDDQLAARSVRIIDDNTHPLKYLRQFRLPHLKAEYKHDARTAGNWLRQQDKKYDLIFIDTCHQYDVDREITDIIVPYLAPGGILAYHDSIACNAPGEVGRLISELINNPKPDLDYVTNIGVKFGIAVFRKHGNNVSEAYNYPQATLLYHFCPHISRPDMVDFHVHCLSRYLPQFTKIRMCIATGNDCQRPEPIEERLRQFIHTDDIQFFHVPNNSKGETPSFFHYLLPSIDENENVFFAHSKGAVFSPQPQGMAWAEFMYAHAMQNTRAAIAHLQNYPVVGCFRKMKPGRGAKWHYAGTFVWFRSLNKIDGYFTPTKFRNRWAVEAWFGKFVPDDRALELLGVPLLKTLENNRGGLLNRYANMPW